MADKALVPGDLELLSGVEHIRKRPGMYVGDLGQTGVHHMLYWALDDILANARAGRGSFVQVKHSHDGSLTISDDGNTMPSPDERGAGITDRLDNLVTEMHAGHDTRGTAPKVQLRDWLVVIRALSEMFTITARVGAEYYTRTYAAGVPMTEWETTEVRSLLNPNMVVRFKPDPEIFERTDFVWDRIRTRLRHMAATYPKLLTDFVYEPSNNEPLEYEHIRMPNGMADMLKVITKDDRFYGQRPKEPLRLCVQQDGLAFDVALQWGSVPPPAESASRRIHSWANTVETRDGSHVLGLKDALRETGLEDVPYYVCISVFVPQPKFVTPTKNELRNPEIRRLIREHLTPALRRLQENDGFALDLEHIRGRRL